MGSESGGKGRVFREGGGVWMYCNTGRCGKKIMCCLFAGEASDTIQQHLGATTDFTTCSDMGTPPLGHTHQ